MKKNFKCKKENLKKEVLSNNVYIARNALTALIGTVFLVINIFGAADKNEVAIVGIPASIGLTTLSIKGMIRAFRENKELNLEIEKLSKKSERKK